MQIQYTSFVKTKSGIANTLVVDGISFNLMYQHLKTRTPKKPENHLDWLLLNGESVYTNLIFQVSRQVEGHVVRMDEDDFAAFKDTIHKRFYSEMGFYLFETKDDYFDLRAAIDKNLEMARAFGETLKDSQ